MPEGVERTTRPRPRFTGLMSRTPMYMRRDGLEIRLAPLMVGWPFLYVRAKESSFVFFDLLSTAPMYPSRASTSETARVIFEFGIDTDSLRAIVAFLILISKSEIGSVIMLF